MGRGRSQTRSDRGIVKAENAPAENLNPFQFAQLFQQCKRGFRIFRCYLLQTGSEPLLDLTPGYIVFGRGKALEDFKSIVECAESRQGPPRIAIRMCGLRFLKSRFPRAFSSVRKIQ